MRSELRNLLCLVLAAGLADGASAQQRGAPTPRPARPLTPAGAVFPVTDFGARPDPAFDSTDAFERAMAAALASTRAAGGYTPRPNAVVRVPGGHDAYRLTRTILVPDGVDLVGDGWTSHVIMENTVRYPMFLVGVDPPDLLPADRPDLFGILDRSAAPRPGVLRGFSTARGRFLQGQHFDLNLGRWRTLRGQDAYDYWETTDTLTVDVCLVRDPARPWGEAKPLCGIGQSCDLAVPRPWVLQTGVTPGTLRLYVADDTFEGEDSRGGYCFDIPVPERAVLRIAFQINCRVGRFAAYVNGVQAAVRPAGPPMKTGHRLRSNDDWPLLVGLSGVGPGSSTDPPTAFTLAGFHMTAAERYVVGQPGEPQRRADRPGEAVTDAWRYFDRTDQAVTIGFLPFTDPPGGFSLQALSGQGWPGSVLVLRGGQGGGLPNRVADLSLLSRGSCLLLGAVLNFRADNVRAVAASAPAVGSVNIGMAYPIELTSCYLSSGDTCYQGFGHIARLHRCYFDQIGRDGVRARGSHVDLIDPFIAQVHARSVAAFRFLPWSFGDATWRVENALIDSEAEGFARCVVEAWQQPAEPTGLTVSHMTVAHTGQTGQPPVPLVWLRSYAGSRAASDAEVTRVRTSGCDAVVRVDGPGWTGSIYAPQAHAAVPVRSNAGAGDPAFLVKNRP